jgi:hypothetical protein
MKYLKSKSGSLENSILSVWSEAVKKEGNAFGMALQAAKENGDKKFTVSGKTYDVKTEMDKVNKVALGKKFKDRKDKDIDNDGDVDSSDKYLHKRRKAVSKAIKGEAKKENFEVGTKERTDHTLKVTPGQSPEEFDQQVNVMQKKHNSMREALAKMWGIEEGKNPFDKKKEEGYNKDKDKDKKEGKTLTGKSQTKVEIEPKMEKKK